MKKNKILGRHCIVDIIYFKYGRMDSIEYIKNVLIESSLESKLHIVDEKFYKFNPIGISGVLILSESHITIHTWPEYNFVAVDAFTCGNNMDPYCVCEKISKKLGGTITYKQEFNRGEYK